MVRFQRRRQDICRYFCPVLDVSSEARPRGGWIWTSGSGLQLPQMPQMQMGGIIQAVTDAGSDHTALMYTPSRAVFFLRSSFLPGQAVAHPAEGTRKNFILPLAQKRESYIFCHLLTRNDCGVEQPGSSSGS